MFEFKCATESKKKNSIHLLTEKCSYLSHINVCIETVFSSIHSRSVSGVNEIEFHKLRYRNLFIGNGKRMLYLGFNFCLLKGPDD